MYTRILRAAGAVATALLLAALVGSATAGRLSVSNRTIRTMWTALEFSGGFVTIRCPATLESSFHSATIRKVVGALLGYITRAAIHQPCIGGTVWYFDDDANEVLGGTFRSTLPWHVAYESFRGALPTVTGVSLSFIDMRFTIRALVLGVTVLCEYRTGPANGGSLSGTFNVNAAGTVTSFGFDEARRITSLSGGLCPEVNLAGAASVRLQGTANSITIRLI
jgi:hypothetical protein